MKFIHSSLGLMLSILLVSSCSKKPDVEYTSTYKMSGEWFARYYSNGAPVTSYHAILTYNTSDPNSNQVWVDDEGQWPLKSKFDVDYPNLTFKPMNNVANAADASIKVKLIEGKVLTGAGRTKSGNTADSIYLRLEFTDDPGKVYELKGHHRSGFFEDEY